MRRCYSKEDKSYRNYGGRGIFVCDRWHDIRNFIADLWDTWPEPDSGLSLDRIDNDGPYSPDNTRWATQSEQCRNTRRNRQVTYRGKLYGSVAQLTDEVFGELGWDRYSLGQKIRSYDADIHGNFDDYLDMEKTANNTNLEEITFQGVKHKSLTALVRYLGLPNIQTIHKRRRERHERGIYYWLYGYPCCALTEKGRASFKGIAHEWEGKQYRSLKDLAKATGISYNTIKTRSKTNPKATAAELVYGPLVIEYRGEYFTSAAALCRQYGVSSSVWKRRRRQQPDAPLAFWLTGNKALLDKD